MNGPQGGRDQPETERQRSNTERRHPDTERQCPECGERVALLRVNGPSSYVFGPCGCPADRDP